MILAGTIRISLLTLAGLVLPPSALFAQANGSAVKAAAPVAAKQLIETEVVQITRQGAFPSQISRKPGVFFLEVINRTPDVQVSLALVPSLPGLSSVAGAIDATGLARKYRSAGLLDLLPGVYQLQSTADKRVLCTITVK